MKTITFQIHFILASILLGAATMHAQVLPKAEPPFKGKIGRTVKDSTPDFPKGVEAPKNAPNILLIMTDDVGFGASSTFGGPIQTPTFQQLADEGLRYNTFHTTALCSPTRAALITGRNHHSCASGVITEMATGYPGYNSVVPKSCGSVGEVLKENGYNTAWFGKAHNVPDWMSSQAGPFDLWPVCVEFQLTRRLGSETIHCNAVATDSSRTTRAVAEVRRSAAPVSPLSVRCDSDIGCRTPCSPRASVRGRSGSKTRSDPDTRAGWFRSAARRKHANGVLREWS